MIFDSHAHYDDKAFDEDRDELLEGFGSGDEPVCSGETESGDETGSGLHNAERTGVIAAVVNVASDITSSRNSIELAARYPFIYAAIGVHPSDVDCLDEDTFKWLRDHCHDEKVVAIGEIGLDYYWEKDPGRKKNQRYWFKRQLELARAESMPVIIHSREAAEETYDILAEYMDGSFPVVVHCYSYSREMAERFLALGCYFGIGGVLTFKKAKKLKETAAFLPDDRILLETDCPYLAPEPNRGKRNDSRNLKYVVKELSSIRGVSESAIEEITWENAQKFYKIS